MIAATTTDPVGVNWSCTPVGACGSFNPGNTVSTATTTYTAPATAGNVTVIATSISDNAINASAAVTITGTVSGPPLGAGNYVYFVNGVDNNPLGAGIYFVAGVFTVDGTGAVTGGEQTFSDFTTFAQDPVMASGSSVAAGNNGNVVITLNTGDAGIGVAGVETFDASLTSATNGLLIEYDSWASGTGTLDLQTSTAAPAGGYAFYAAGLDINGFTIVTGGVVNVDSAGTGGISGAGSVFDQNDGGTLSPDQLFAASTVTAPDTFGSVTFTLNPQTVSATVLEFTMVGYIVDADNIKWVEDWTVDNLRASTGGVAFGQNGKNGTFDSTNLSGGSGVFGAAGFDINGPLQTAGLVTFNADGSLSGVVSYNDLVAVSGNGGDPLIAGGTWTIDGPGTGNDGGTGRVTMASVSDGVNTFNLQLYLAHHTAVVISMDGTDQLAGLGYGQTGSGAFTAASFTGNYALSEDQQDPANTIFGIPNDGVGSFTADGTSAFTGSLDQNIGFVPTAGTAGNVTGTFTSDPSGVFTGTITGIDTVSATTADTFTFYLIGSASGASTGVIGIEDDGLDKLTVGTFVLQQ
jgi:hypothetical protein